MASRWVMDSTTFCVVWAKNLKSNTTTNDAGITEKGDWGKFVHELWAVFYPMNSEYKFVGKNDLPLSSADGQSDFNPENKDDAYFFLSEKAYQKAANIARDIRSKNKKHNTDFPVPPLPHGYLRRAGSKTKSKRAEYSALASLFA